MRSYSVYKYSNAIKRHWRNQSMQVLTSPILICYKTQYSTLQVGFFYTVTVILNDSLECFLHNKHVSNQCWNVFLFPHKLIKSIFICSKTQFSTLQVGFFYTVTVILNDSLECFLHNKHVSNQCWNVFLFPHKLIKSIST